MKFNEYRKGLEETDKKDLVKRLLNDRYNRFLSDHADLKDKEEDERGHGKRLPYIGWFWRDVDWSSGTFPIGDSGTFVGFMENNKWGYPERNVTSAEFERVVAIVDSAMEKSYRGGSLDEIIKITNEELEILWDVFASMQVGEPTPKGGV